MVDLIRSTGPNFKSVHDPLGIKDSSPFSPNELPRLERRLPSLEEQSLQSLAKIRNNSPGNVAITAPEQMPGVNDKVPTSTLPSPVYYNITDRPLAEIYPLTLRQKPIQGCVAGSKERDRKPLDPPPIIQLKIRDNDAAQQWLQSPYFFMVAILLDKDTKDPVPIPAQAVFAGQVTSSLHRLKDFNNEDGGFFIFGDLSIKVQGEWCLGFTLYEIRRSDQLILPLNTIVTEPFRVYESHDFPGLSESTFLSRSFAEQGVRIRIRKEARGSTIRGRIIKRVPGRFQAGLGHDLGNYSTGQVSPRTREYSLPAITGTLQRAHTYPAATPFSPAGYDRYGFGTSQSPSVSRAMQYQPPPKHYTEQEQDPSEPPNKHTRNDYASYGSAGTTPSYESRPSMSSSSFSSFSSQSTGLPLSYEPHGPSQSSTLPSMQLSLRGAPDLSRTRPNSWSESGTASQAPNFTRQLPLPLFSRQNPYFQDSQANTNGSTKSPFSLRPPLSSWNSH